jgi:hypothetical protein
MRLEVFILYYFEEKEIELILFPPIHLLEFTNGTIGIGISFMEALYLRIKLVALMLNKCFL